MRRKLRRPVHYLTFAYCDGAVVGCSPIRKPSKRRIKEEGLRIDADLVCNEHYYSADQFAGWEIDFRVRVADLLANRMNMRRTVRDLVTPELAGIKASLADLAAGIARIEAALSRLENVSGQ